ncbi:hypothetical protein [Catellatospora methionotrophica]|uniref:hypothetical protein n=1 Tax=Catellatospora methionotrophica TaxID=121620 RepID=UPI0033F18F97
MTLNPYRAPLPAAKPPTATAHDLPYPATTATPTATATRTAAATPTAAATAAVTPVPSAGERRRRRVRRVRSGIWNALAGHGLALTIPLLPAAPSGEPSAVYGVGFVIAQLVLATAVVALGITRTLRRDGANSVGLAIGWIAGMPVAAVAGVALLFALAAR